VVRDGDHTRSWWRTLLDAQRRAGFPDLAGSEGTAQLALSDALLNQFIAARLPDAWPITELTVHALERNELAVRVRPRTAWLPPVRVRLTIDQEPATAANPQLRARFRSRLAGLAGSALGATSLPRWVRMSGDCLTVDLEALAAQHGVVDLLPAVRMLTVSTEPGRVILRTALAASRA